jgi:hypothetical protein
MEKPLLESASVGGEGARARELLFLCRQEEGVHVMLMLLLLGRESGRDFTPNFFLSSNKNPFNPRPPILNIRGLSLCDRPPTTQSPHPQRQ